MKIIISIFLVIFLSVVTSAVPVRSMFASRNYIFNSQSPKPYDSAVEYIDITQSAYIETLIHPTNSLDLRIDGCWLSSVSSLGSMMGLSFDNPSNLRYRSNNYCEWSLKVREGGSSWQRIDIQTTKRHLYQGGASGIWVDGVRVSTNSFTFSSSNYTDTFKIASSTKGNAWRPGACRLYRFTVVDGTDTIMDLIPVRFNNEGAMYDIVSKKVFRNANSIGVIVSGPDKE